MSVAAHQTSRVLDGSYVLDRPADVTEVVPRTDVLAVVFGLGGSTVMRRDDSSYRRRLRSGLAAWVVAHGGPTEARRRPVGAGHHGTRRRRPLTRVSAGQGPFYPGVAGEGFEPS
ncbi:MAG: hypothetical protein V7646_1358 [Pseudonocardia sp.]